MSVPTRTVNGLDPEVARAGCLEMLEITRDNLERAKRTREHFIRLSRMYGLTNQTIADALGMTEAGVRRITQRAARPGEV